MSGSKIKGFSELSEFFDEVTDVVEDIGTLEGVIVKDGKVINSNLNIDELRLSENDKDAVDEFNYVNHIKKGTISDEDKASLERLLRDLIESKTRGKL